MEVFFRSAFFFLREIKMASGKRVRIESMFALCFFTFGRYRRQCRRSGDVTSFTTCRSFFCVRLITNTYCECTRVARYKSEVSRKKKRVSTKKVQNSPEKNVGVGPVL